MGKFTISAIAFVVFTTTIVSASYPMYGGWGDDGWGWGSDDGYYRGGMIGGMYGSGIFPGMGGWYGNMYSGMGSGGFGNWGMPYGRWGCGGWWGGDDNCGFDG